MKKDIQPNVSDTFPSSELKQSSNIDESPLHSSIIEQFSNPLSVSLLSPFKKRSVDMTDGLEMKNYPSKITVCKGASSTNVIPFSANTSNSPIVQYYAGIIQSPDKIKPGQYSPEIQYQKNEKPFYHQSSFKQIIPQNYNFSPSSIFNPVSHKKSSDSESNTSSAQTPKQSAYVNKTLQEKLEGNFQLKKSPNEGDTIQLKGSDNQNESSSEEGEKGKGNDSSEEEEENAELYMLTFNSDDEKRDVKGGNGTMNQQPNHHHHHQHLEQHQQQEYLQERKERETKEKSNKNAIKNKFDEVNAHLSQKHHSHSKKQYINDMQQPSYYKDDIKTEYNQMQLNNINPQLICNDMNRTPIVNEQLSSTLPPYLDYQMMSSQRGKRVKRLDPISYVDQPYDVLAKNLYLLTKDQGGCRYLQKILEQDPVNVTNALYPPLIEFIFEVVIDPFGNYLIQKLFNYLNPNQLQEVMIILSPNILDIGAHSQGTRVIQQLINYLSTPILVSTFVNMIMPVIIPLLNELNGTHIIQKFCSLYSKESYDIFLLIIENCLSLATHRHGCCVLQKYLETFNTDLHNKLLDKLLANCLLLIIDQFGNYVIQSILYLKDTKSSNAIAVKLLENVSYYSKHKYSSNVVEKCFDYCDNDTRQLLIAALSKQEIINDLIMDEHGNYVVQKVLACTDFSTQSQLLKGIIPLFSKINELPFGEHIISRLVISYPQLSTKATGTGGGRDTNTSSNNSNINRNYREGGGYNKRGGGYYYNNNKQNNQEEYNQNRGKDYPYKNYSGGYNNNQRYNKGGNNNSTNPSNNSNNNNGSKQQQYK